MEGYRLLPPAQTHHLSFCPQTFVPGQPGKDTQSGAGKAARSASRRSEGNLFREKGSSGTPLKRNLELPTTRPLCQLLLPYPSSASLRLPHLLPLAPAKHFAYRVLFWRQKAPTSSLTEALSPLRRQHGANLGDSLLPKEIIFLFTLAGASLAPPEGLCHPCNPPSPGPQARLNPPFPRIISR